MKKLLISAAATALLFGTAMAAPDNDNDQQRHRHTMQGPAAQSDSMRANQSDRDNNQINANGNANANTNADVNDKHIRRNVTVNRDIDVNRNETVNRDVNINRNVTVNRNVNVNRNIATRCSNFNVADYRRNVRADRHFHIGFYTAPRATTTSAGCMASACPRSISRATTG